MQNPPPITTELFRFVTLRQPQLLEPAKKDVGFVHHPDLSKSEFFTKPDENIAQARAQIRRVAKTFEPARNPGAVRSINAELFDFGLWLAQWRGTLVAAELVDRSAGIQPLSEPQLLMVWDHLFYYLHTETKPTVREYCVLLLLGQHFITHTRNNKLRSLANQLYWGNHEFPDDDAKKNQLVKRIAWAAVVVPKAFSFGAHQVSEDQEKPQVIVPKHQVKQDDPRLRQINDRANAGSRYRKLSTANREVAKLYRGEPASANQSVAALLKKFGPKLSETTVALLGDGRYGSGTLKEARGLIGSDMRDENRIRRDGKAKLGDDASRGIGNYCYLIKLDTTGKYDKLSLSIKVPGAAIKLSGGSLKVLVDQNQIATLPMASAELLETEGDIHTYNLEPGRQLEVQADTTYTVRGSLELSDGKVIDVDLALSAKKPTANDCAGAIVTPDKEDDWTWDESDDRAMEFYGVNHIGLGIFRRVEQQVCCYVPGEVSRIENVMAREYKERSTRSLTSTETATETEEAFEIEMETDTSSTVRNELQSEIAKVLENTNDTSIGASAEVSGSKFGVEVRAGGSLDLSMGTAASTSDSAARLYAEEVTNAAAERVTNKTTVKRSTKVLQEFEEKNRHGYDNRAGDEHVTGVYRWIDIIYTNRLVNYGAMEMVEFTIPEPAKFYKKVKFGPDGKKPGAGRGGRAGKAPVHPRDHGLTAPSAVSEDPDDTLYYEDLAGIYGVTLPQPPNPTEQVSEMITKTGIKESVEDTDRTTPVVLPTGYELSKVKYSGTINYDSTDNKGTNWIIAAHGEDWKFDKKGGAANNQRDYDPAGTLSGYPSGISGPLTASFHYERTRSYTLNFDFIGVPTAATMLNWKTEVYDDVMAAYEAQLAEFEATVEEYEQEKEEEKATLGTGSIATNRATEMREIKRQAIEMLSRRYGFRVGDDYLVKDGCGIPVLNTAPAPTRMGTPLDWRTYAAHVKFFEQVFDWELMSYLFYPYYWADRCDWEDLLQLENRGDPTFEAFLQSGMARAVIPVRRGFERALNYYFQTGLINNGGNLVLDTDDDLYLSIDEELSETKGRVEKEWETRVPTTLTIIQGNSVYLDDQGLPCCHDEDRAGEGLIPKNSLLGVVRS